MSLSGHISTPSKNVPRGPFGDAASSDFSFSKATFFVLALGYVAFQKKLLPKPLGRIAARLYFYPTMPFTYGLRWGHLVTKMDNFEGGSNLFMGVAPIAFAAKPAKLYSQLGIRGVVNLCDEYGGPTEEYARLGIEELHIPTIDHHEPSLSSLRAAVKFIAKFKEKGQSVYVHCKAGHGRSAAVVFCWLVTQSPGAKPSDIAQSMINKRKVRKNLHLQHNTAAFHEEFVAKMKTSDNTAALSKENDPRREVSK
mmetsp:Transcript_78763/g.154025  ORF Transcript_78763/g.154025 Transcript_78763/m.154025 type:complete len:253 (-) Transcript_78763:112-870(-)